MSTTQEYVFKSISVEKAYLLQPTEKISTSPKELIALLTTTSLVETATDFLQLMSNAEKLLSNPTYVKQLYGDLLFRIIFNEMPLDEIKTIILTIQTNRQ